MDFDKNFHLLFHHVPLNDSDKIQCSILFHIWTVINAVVPHADSNKTGCSALFHIYGLWQVLMYDLVPHADSDKHTQTIVDVPPCAKRTTIMFINVPWYCIPQMDSDKIWFVFHILPAMDSVALASNCNLQWLWFQASGTWHGCEQLQLAMVAVAHIHSLQWLRLQTATTCNGCSCKHLELTNVASVAILVGTNKGCC